MSFFSEMLRKLRNDKGITQAQLAKEIGVSKSSINMYERGEREPSYSTLQKISQYFNISTDALLGNEVFINNLAEAGKSMRKTLREIALEHHFIDNYGYEHFSDIDVYKRQSYNGTSKEPEITTDESGIFVTRNYYDANGIPLVRFSEVSDAPHAYTPEISEIVWDDFFSKITLNEDGSRIYDGQKIERTTTFTDIAADAYYADAVTWAVDNDITNGLTATTFGPDETVSRAQMEMCIRDRLETAVCRAFGAGTENGRAAAQYFEEISGHSLRDRRRQRKAKCGGHESGMPAGGGGNAPSVLRDSGWGALVERGFATASDLA